MTTITLGSKLQAGSFNFYSDLSDRYVAHKNIYPKDINGDGVDEIFFAGFETQPNTPSTFSNTSVHIFGWVNGKLQEITNQWLPGNMNQVEGVGDIAFGDFNGDGLVDAFLSAYTDMEHSVNAYQLINKGNYFEKVIIGRESWQHDVASADINNDGYYDVFATGYGSAPALYLGSAFGLIEHQEIHLSGSGIALGDFLGNGSISAIVVDHAKNQNKDTALYTFKFTDTSTPLISFYSALPDARLDLAKYGPHRDSLGNSHDIRAEPFDFTHDGLLDVLVFSRMTWNGTSWPEISEVQFLKNHGNGVFEDVTDTILIGYKNETNISYNPIIADFNKDGLKDIYLSESSFSSSYDSTAILLQKSNGKFIETARTQLSNLVPNAGGVSNIVLGPDENFYVVVEANLEANKGIQTISAYKLNFIENRMPMINKALADVNLTEGKAISYSIGAAFADPDKSDVLSYSLTLEDGSSLPEWLSFNASTKKLTGTLPYNADNNLNLKVTATDLEGLSISDSFSINVKNVTSIKGTSKADVIKAGAGNDTINGGLGSDTLTGGLGNDTFVFNTKLGASNIDTITDFTSGDKIALAGSIFSKLKGDKDLSDNFAWDSATTDKQFLIYNIATKKLYYDADGSGTKATQIEVAIIGLDSLVDNNFTISFYSN
jgi:hypothetical protein